LSGHGGLALAMQARAAAASEHGGQARTAVGGRRQVLLEEHTRGVFPMAKRAFLGDAISSLTNDFFFFYFSFLVNLTATSAFCLAGKLLNRDRNYYQYAIGSAK